MILSASGDSQIFNEDAGEWDCGVWFSNKTYKEDRKNIKGSTSRIITENGQQKEEITFSSGRKRYKYIKATENSNQTTRGSLMPPPTNLMQLHECNPP